MCLIEDYKQLREKVTHDFRCSEFKGILDVGLPENVVTTSREH